MLVWAFLSLRDPQPTLLYKQYHSLLLLTSPIELSQVGLFTKAVHNLKGFESFSTITYFTVHSLSSVQQPTATPKSPAGNFRLYAKEKKSAKFKQALWLWLLLLPQESGSHVRVSSHSAALWYIPSDAAPLVLWSYEEKDWRRRSWIWVERKLMKWFL